MDDAPIPTCFPKICADCGQLRLIHYRITSIRCDACIEARMRRRTRLANGAHSKVRTAVLNGKLPALTGSILCVDCGAPAKQYDHRSYKKPLDVAPVCIPCNRKRGPAIEVRQLREAGL